MHFLWTYLISHSFADTIFVPTRTKEKSQQVVLQSLYQGLKQNGWDVRTSVTPCFTYNCHNNNGSSGDFYVEVYFSQRKSQLTATFLLFDQQYTKPIGRYSIHSSSWEGLASKAKVAPRSWVRESTRTSRNPSKEPVHNNQYHSQTHTKPKTEQNNKPIPVKSVPTKIVQPKKKKIKEEENPTESNQKLAYTALKKGLCSEADTYVNFWKLDNPNNVEVMKYKALVSECKKENVLTTLQLFEKYIEYGGSTSSVSENIRRLQQQLAQAKITIQKENRKGKFENASTDDFHISFSDGEWNNRNDYTYELNYSYPSTYTIKVKSSDIWYKDTSLEITTNKGQKQRETIRLTSIENQLMDFFEQSKCSEGLAIIDSLASKNTQDSKLLYYQAEGARCEERWLDALSLYENYQNNGGTKDVSRKIRKINQKLYQVQIQIEVPEASDTSIFSISINNVKVSPRWVDNIAYIDVDPTLPQPFKLEVQSTSSLYSNISEEWEAIAGSKEKKNFVVKSTFDEINELISQKECSHALTQSQRLLDQMPTSLDVIYIHAQSLLCENQSPVNTLKMFEKYQSSGGKQDISSELRLLHNKLYQSSVTFVGSEFELDFSKLDIIVDDERWKSIDERSFLLQYTEPRDITIEVRSRSPFIQSKTFTVKGMAGKNENIEFTLPSFQPIDLQVPRFTNNKQVRIEWKNGDEQQQVDIQSQQNTLVSKGDVSVIVEMDTGKKLQYTLEITPEMNKLLLPWTYDIVFDKQVLFSDTISPLERTLEVEDIAIASPIPDIEDIHVQYTVLGTPNQHTSINIDKEIISNSNLLGHLHSIDNVAKSLKKMKRRKVLFYSAGILSVGVSGYMQYLAYNYAAQANQIRDIQDSDLFNSLESNLRIVNINTGVGLASTALVSGGAYAIGKYRIPKVEEHQKMLLDELPTLQKEVIQITPTQNTSSVHSIKEESLQADLKKKGSDK